MTMAIISTVLRPLPFALSDGRLGRTARSQDMNTPACCTCGEGVAEKRQCKIVQTATKDGLGGVGERHNIKITSKKKKNQEGQKEWSLSLIHI